MDLNKLKEIGFTEGEIKVYESLIKLRKSTITKIIENSGVSSSKVYLILDKLTNKGLVNYIVKNNIKEFHLADPENLLDFIKDEKKKLEEAEEHTKELIDSIKKSLKKYVEESANIYRGLLGLKTAHMNLINELNKGEEYVFFSVEKDALQNKYVQLMFKSIHAKRDARGVTARGIALPELREVFKKHFPSKKEYKIKFHELTLNQGITIGKNRIIIETAYPDTFAVEIISPQTAKSYREFFNKIWNMVKI
ncbi:MAG TPA: helix-turn-helix domain-containing protein [Candidatus Nanoarchaeia archaeon]|nr:helix-turn-helix domain-containing protein [Candidatus Nanoarchaeia archaeon]